jgi:hypothetical protein
MKESPRGEEELRRRWHLAGRRGGEMVEGGRSRFLHYHAVPGNMDSLNSFRAQLIWRSYRRFGGGANETG